MRPDGSYQHCHTQHINISTVHMPWVALVSSISAASLKVVVMDPNGTLVCGKTQRIIPNTGYNAPRNDE